MKAQLAGIDWDVCEPTRITPRSTITINIEDARASITLLAYEAAGYPKAFKLLYSSERNTVGFRCVEPRDALAVLVHHDRNRTGKGRGIKFAAGMLARRMRADGYSGSICVPVQWHPDGLLWGDLTMATKRIRKAPMKRGAA